MGIAIRPTAGTKVYADATAPATFDAAGYGALSWTEVKGFDTIAQIGGVMEVGNFDAITEGRIKYRFIEDPGEWEAAPADLPGDAGQAVLATAFAASRGTSAEKISIRIEDEGGYGTYAQVMVSTWARTYGGASDIAIRNVVMPIIAGTVVEYTP